MKATLLVNLKTNTGFVYAGKTFDDSVEEFPEYVTSNLENDKVIKLTPSVTEVKSAKEQSAKAAKPALNKK